jgi:hypothetical protein
VSHKTYPNRDDLTRAQNKAALDIPNFYLVAEIKLTSFLGSNLYTPAGTLTSVGGHAVTLQGLYRG